MHNKIYNIKNILNSLKAPQLLSSSAPQLLRCLGAQAIKPSGHQDIIETTAPALLTWIFF